ncbi:MAG: SDR family NAD(P)-dependent oxidoreductase [Acidobacteriota bacterium]
MKLKEKVAVITGGGTGIGRDAAMALAREGAKIIVSGRRLEPLEETVQLIKSEGGEAAAVSADVTNWDSISALQEATKKLYGNVDILVNNAGSALYKPFLDITLEEFDYVMNIDLRSVFAVTKAFVPMMIENGGGSVINISSILGVFGGMNQSAYCAAKGGVNNMTRALAAELGPMQIRVNCICPSHIETPMMAPMLDHLKEKGKMEKLEKVFPLRRIGFPADTSGAVLFYAGPDSSWVTGTIMVLDGGMSCFV